MSDEEGLNAAYAALADPNRRKILALLREAEALRVSDIASTFDMSLNGVSKHLKILENAGLITRTVDGRNHWIQPRWEGMQAPYEWLHFHHHFWSERVDAFVDYVGQKARASTTRTEVADAVAGAPERARAPRTAKDLASSDKRKKERE